MLTRRGILIGAGKLLTLAFVERAEAFIELNQEPLLLPHPKPVTTIGAFWDNDEGWYLLSVGGPTEGPPPAPTWREFLRGRGEMTLDPETLDDMWGLTLSDLDRPVGDDVWSEAWLDMTAEGEAFDLLYGLDLGPDLAGDSDPQVQFHEGGMMGASGRWAIVPDAMSLSLLQARLVELDVGVSLS